MAITGSARLFGGDSPATGEPATISIVASQLDVHAGDKHVASPLSEVRVREVGTGDVGIELAWDTPAGIRAVQIFDKAALAALRSNPEIRALPQMAKFRVAQRRGSALRTFGFIVLGIFLALPLMLLSLFVWQADRMAGAAASRVSVEQETAFGEQAFASMKGSLKLQESGPAYDAVQNIGTRLTAGSKYRYRFHVAEDDAINAFAIPGGIVVVHTGLIKATRRPEELAGVLAHEVQHVEQRHSLQALVKDLGLRGVWLLVTGDIGGGLIGQAALELTSLSFSRDAEAQADAKGFDELVEAGIDPSGMADFFTILSKQESAATPPALLSTHPASEAREATMRARETEVKGKAFAPLELGAWPPSK